MFYIFTATMNSVRRNGRGTHDIVKENHYELRGHKEDLSELLTICRDIKNEVENSNFKLKMDTVEVGGVYFPAPDNETIMRFLEPDSEFQLRRRGFHELMKCVVSPCKKKFCEALLTNLFTLEYKQKHKWQSVG